MAAKKVSPGQQFEINGEKFRVERVVGKEARLVKVGVKPGDAIEVDGSLKYRRLATLERMLSEQKPARKSRSRKAAQAELVEGVGISDATVEEIRANERELSVA